MIEIIVLVIVLVLILSTTYQIGRMSVINRINKKLKIK